jgi:hypothetical protein
MRQVNVDVFVKSVVIRREIIFRPALDDNSEEIADGRITLLLRDVEVEATFFVFFTVGHARPSPSDVTRLSLNAFKNDLFALSRYYTQNLP